MGLICSWLMLSGDGNKLKATIGMIDILHSRFFLCMKESEEKEVPVPDPEKLLLLVNYVRGVAHYLESLDGVEIIVKNQITWPKLGQ